MSSSKDHGQALVALDRIKTKLDGELPEEVQVLSTALDRGFSNDLHRESMLSMAGALKAVSEAVEKGDGALASELTKLVTMLTATNTTLTVIGTKLDGVTANQISPRGRWALSVLALLIAGAALAAMIQGAFLTQGVDPGATDLMQEAFDVAPTSPGGADD